MIKPAAHDCIFCKLIGEGLDADLRVFENEHLIVQISRQQKPDNHGHVLVIPKAHVQNIYELPINLEVPIMAALRMMACAVKKAFVADGISIRQNNEPAAGQDVFHIHFHVIPHFNDDSFKAVAYAVVPIKIRSKQAIEIKKRT